MLQLNPPIPVNTPKGKGWAHVLIDYSQEHDLLWVVFLDETGECWTLPNRDIRIQSNLSLGRRERETNLEQSHARAVEPRYTSVPESNRPPQHTVVPDPRPVAPPTMHCPPPVRSRTEDVDTPY